MLLSLAEWVMVASFVSRVRKMLLSVSALAAFIRKPSTPSRRSSRGARKVKAVVFQTPHRVFTLNHGHESHQRCVQCRVFFAPLTPSVQRHPAYLVRQTIHFFRMQ